jgi:uncharacterized membrane protein
MRLRRTALIGLLALLAIGLLALAWLSGAHALQLLAFVAIVGVAAWGLGRETRVTVRNPRVTQPVAEDAVPAEKQPR